jgi:hypothetical protein
VRVARWIGMGVDHEDCRSAHFTGRDAVWWGSRGGETIYSEAKETDVSLQANTQGTLVVLDARWNTTAGRGVGRAEGERGNTTHKDAQSVWSKRGTWHESGGRMGEMGRRAKAQRHAPLGPLSRGEGVLLVAPTQTPVFFSNRSCARDKTASRRLFIRHRKGVDLYVVLDESVHPPQYHTNGLLQGMHAALAHYNF